MRFRCPNCDHAIQVTQPIESPDLTELRCPSCDSRIHIADAETATFEAVNKHIGHFELVSELGSGSFGTVFKAWDKRLKRNVAVKIPRNGQLTKGGGKAFLKEAQAASQISHPNVVHTYEVGQLAENVYYVVSECIDGVSLTEWLQSRKSSRQDKIEMMVKLCHAVQAAHDAGIIHRDLKPGNILVDKDNEPHITDFGLAKQTLSPEITVTHEGAILGTPSYMSPEQAAGRVKEIGKHSDVYSLGVILYQMLSGKRPFEGTNSKTLLHQIRNEEPSTPRSIEKSIPKDLNNICMQAMRRKPEERYKSARAMAEDLSRFLKGDPVIARKIPTSVRIARRIKRNPALTSLAISLVALVGLTIYLVAFRDEPTKAAPPTPTLTHPVEISFTKNGVAPTSSDQCRWAVVPLDEFTREPIIAKIIRGTGPILQLDLEPGEYLIVIDVRGFGFHEVYRRVPVDPHSPSGSYNHHRWSYAEGVLILPAIRVIPTGEVTSGMTMVGGGSFQMGPGVGKISPVHTRTVDDFYIDPMEVTVSAYDVEMVLPEAYERDPNLPRGSFPIVALTWHAAVAYAEKVGKRLITEAEYEIVATNRGTTSYPWGDDGSRIENWDPHPVGTLEYDVANDFFVRGLCSNAVEWTDSVQLPYPGGEDSFIDAMRNEFADSRGVRGGLLSALTKGNFTWIGGVRRRENRRVMTRDTYIGFRCGRSVEARFVD